MIKLTVLNQRGGVGKTTTALTVARWLADQHQKTLLVDADPQGSINTILRLKPRNHLFDFLIQRYALEDCIESPCENLQILCGNRATADAEKQLMGEIGRERVFENVFGPYCDQFDAIIIDVGPSVSLMQTCAMVYAEKVLIPVNTDLVSVSGAAACLQFCQTLSKAVRTKVEPVGLLPTMIDRRIGLTKIIRGLLEELAQTYQVPILHEIRTDTAVGKSTRGKQFLVDLDPSGKAMEDYIAACTELFPSIAATGMERRSIKNDEAIPQAS